MLTQYCAHKALMENQLRNLPFNLVNMKRNAEDVLLSRIIFLTFVF